MFTIKARNFEVKGNIVGFDPGSENLLVTFEPNILIEFKNPAPSVLVELRQAGLVRLKNAELNFMNKRPLTLLDATVNANQPKSREIVSPNTQRIV